MNKAIFKQPFFYTALVNFILALAFIFQKGYVARLGSFLCFSTFIVSFYKTNKAVRKK
ncbi:hypothetical protein SAMN04488700_1644 [Carnobacterium iners]|uniref:Uncharacterized protein n=1 Tax=Carnobacterium iners TaxID=1073423 RepID=A0A1X7NBR2_9LACT|nr:hypothetical protein [Carnobacterium iners]SEK49924.1 hypothetical protein SAMN04488114_1057 [Carnobacterium iners]SMH34179.1 hypothetical protein SAMN04488700_1644 [Carnobacterium iners]